MTLETVHVPLSSLHPYPGNPRRGNVPLIAESLQRNGQYRPIVARPDGTILAGNHTWQAAQTLGWGTIAVVFVDVDDEHARRIVLADNRLNDVAGYDMQALLELLADTADRSGTGWDYQHVAELTALLEASSRTWVDRPGPSWPRRAAPCSRCRTAGR